MEINTAAIVQSAAPVQASTVQSDAPTGVAATVPLEGQAPATEPTGPRPGESFSEFMAAKKAFQAERMKMQQELEQTKGRYSKLAPAEKMAQEKNLVGLLDHFGFSYDDITQQVLANSDPMEMKFKDLERRMENEKKSREEEASKQKEEMQSQAVTNYKKQISDHVASNAEKYELVAYHDASDSVYDVIKGVYEAHGKMIDFDEACEKVEAYLEAEVEKVLALNKIKGKFAPKTDNGEQLPPEMQKIIEERKARTTAPSLSNFNSSSAPAIDPSQLTREQRFEMARKQLTGN